jgi:hypothetical protein
LVRGLRRCPDVYGDGVVLLGFPCKCTREREIWALRWCSEHFREEAERKRGDRRQPPPLPSIYRNSDELRQWIGIIFEVEWLGE